jgi:hypothetical protein
MAGGGCGVDLPRGDVRSTGRVHRRDVPTKVRYMGASMGYQLAGILDGALAPIISVALFDRFDTSVVVSVYAVAMLLVTIIGVFIAPEISKTDVHTEDVELVQAQP